MELMSEILREWRDSAVAWREYSATIRTMFGSVTKALIEEAEISAGQGVLDVAGGPGEPSLTIATAPPRVVRTLRNGSAA